jgi:tetratricopeptide (TPR) repeat protein
MVTLRDKQALVIPSDKAPMLMTTPANPPTPQEQEFTSKGKLDDSGTFTGHVEQLYSGDMEVALRMGFRQLSQSQWREGVQRFSYGLGFGGDVSNVTVTPPDETDKPFRISYDYVRKGYSGWDDRQITPPVPPNMGIESAKDAKKPPESVLLGAPGEIVYRSKLSLPPGYTVVAPKGADLVEPYAEYHSTATVQDGVLISSRRLVIKKSEVALENWESFRDFGKAVSDDEWKIIPLNGAATNGDGDIAGTLREGIDALQRQDFKGAETSFQKVIAAQPKYPSAHLDLGTALLMQGKIDAALVEFHKEQEVSPDELRAYQVPAIYLTRSGRREDAIAEWRRLLKVHPQNYGAALSVGQLLSQEGKYSDAAAELENAVNVSPKNAELQFALGSTYLKAGQSEKAVAHIRAAVEDGGAKPAAMALNNAAYELADNNTSLQLARQYAEDALKQLEERSVNDVAAEDTGTEVTYQLSLVWDTLGWVYFQSGGANRAETFVRAAWLLGQDAIVGEHLGEIYEKQGKSKEAAHVYELALAAQGSTVFRMTPQTMVNVPYSPTFSTNSQDQGNKILSRYKKLTGRSPALQETRRLSNGEWTKTPAEELSQMRATRLGKIPNLVGSAEFSIVFVPGRVESAEYLRGEDSLEALTDKLKAAHYQVEFPDGSKAKIFRRAQLSCTPSAGCMVVLVPPDKALPQQNPGQY